LPSNDARKPLQRNIYFYKIPSRPNGGAVDLPSLVARVDELPWSSEQHRYWPQVSGDDIAMWSHSRSGDRFVLGTIRRSAFPRTERAGLLTDLAVTAGDGLHEGIHAIVFDNGIVGIEYNFYGPRPSRIPAYIQYALPESLSFTLEPILRNDVLQRLSKQKEIRVVELQIRRGYADQVALAHEDLGAAFAQLANASDAEVLGIVLRPELNARTPLAKKAKKQLKRLARLAGLRENAVSFKVRGLNEETGRVEPLDLLSDHLVVRKSILRQSSTSNAVDAESAFDAIEEAYLELRDELEEASSVGVLEVSSNDDAG